MDELVAFLRACTDADQEWSHAVLADPGAANDHGIARRMLREVEAKRRVLDAYTEALETSAAFARLPSKGMHMAVAAESYLNVIQWHAAAYDSHPDYRPEWRRP